jgi:hypothetical protein
MAGSPYLYKFLSTFWDKFPKKVRDRNAELWNGYEQVIGDIYQRFMDLDLSTSIANVPVYLTERWNRYYFDSTNQVLVPATFKSYQDIGGGVNLSEKYLVNISVNGEPAIEVDCRGRVPASTSISEIISKINAAFGFPFASAIFDNTILFLTSRGKGPQEKITISAASIPLNDGTEYILGLVPEELPLLTPRLPYKYSLVDPQIRRILSLQNAVRVESVTHYIIEGLDFEVKWREGTVDFAAQPDPVMWAKLTYRDYEVPFYNFGYLIDYRDPTISPEDYLQNLQGLWFAYWMGPRPEFIKRALCLMFGLPVAVDDGLILSVNGSEMQILHMDGSIKTYFLPSQLNWILKKDDYCEKYEPLVDGIDIYDKTNRPGFVQTEIGRDAIKVFALDNATVGTDPNSDESKALKALEEHSFLPQINVNAFIRPNINVGSIFRFLESIKPLHKQFYFQVIVAVFGEELAIKEKLVLGITFDVTPNLDINQANWAPVDVREGYESSNIPALDLDSDMMDFFERGSLSFSDNTGPLPQHDVLF